MNITQKTICKQIHSTNLRANGFKISHLTTDDVVIQKNGKTMIIIYDYVMDTYIVLMGWKRETMVYYDQLENYIFSYFASDEVTK